MSPNWPGIAWVVTAICSAVGACKVSSTHITLLRVLQEGNTNKFFHPTSPNFPGAEYTLTFCRYSQLLSFSYSWMALVIFDSTKLNFPVACTVLLKPSKSEVNSCTKWKGESLFYWPHWTFQLPVLYWESHLRVRLTAIPSGYLKHGERPSW